MTRQLPPDHPLLKALAPKTEEEKVRDFLNASKRPNLKGQDGFAGPVPISLFKGSSI